MTNREGEQIGDEIKCAECGTLSEYFKTLYRSDLVDEVFCTKKCIVEFLKRTITECHIVPFNPR